MSATTVSRVLSPEDATELIGAKVDELEANVTTETYARDADTGELVFAYVPVAPVADLRKAVLDLKMNHTLRAEHFDNHSRTFGYRTRKPQMSREGCGLSIVAREHPWAHAVLEDWADRLTQLYHGFADELATADAEVLDQVQPDWRMGLWTSGVVNRSSRLPYHRDRNNFPTWSAMPVLRRGMAGGHLSIPEYNAVIACRDGWALFFPGYRYVHGVTPMWLTQPDGYRYSIVYYALQGMKDCHTAAVETALIRQRRTERERAMAQRLAGGDTTIPGSRRRTVAADDPV